MLEPTNTSIKRLQNLHNYHLNIFVIRLKVCGIQFSLLTLEKRWATARRGGGADIIKQSTAIQQSVCRVLTPYNLHRAMPISLALASLLALSHLEIPDKGTKIATGRYGEEAAAMVTNQALRLYKQSEKMSRRLRLLVYLRTELLNKLCDKCWWHKLRHRIGL